MLHFDVLTLFPKIFSSFLEESLIKKSIEQQYLKVDLVNYRRHGRGKHLQVDDTPYGGGPGMLLRIEPIAETLEEQKKKNHAAGLETHTVLLTPQGQPFTQAKAKQLSRCKAVLTLICGRYEGFDERIRSLVDEEISGGDFICLGGEVIAMTMIETISRLVPNILGNQESTERESFTQSLLEYPQYTRPASYEGMDVPKELLSGNHKVITEWREEQALVRTKKRRPDLL
ncbi:MAG: tRNA (guanosine(37)-N1)-methyltransferase TrmD [Deltaproteobacteria bacterium]|mgnify:FL=1|jgi:tRNA (guanine37-N1)-methyltransferase|nr:tRNA (guanosine(37)-N1)-methyltransferase TrmD [Deltaproteobacteria bacterium]HAF89698.1 tRNA (guanosine(37)-N1)-methyltransferase TrmD [Deltaproteobacteria bacterium]|tara:strand:- start:3661 stop:4347 length:687 start_codon:yes stop_codon:yes gene_type:complete